ncbi:MAG: phosphoribulokinase [Betaproteobacteria bacterium TMED82]|nr:MAG: phosphoribulokinase [Betaproteobacteria bacterium TMED82]
MSKKHPIIAITGSSGAGTSTVLNSFRHIFRREGLRVQIVQGDSFHRYDREEMKKAMRAAEKRGNQHFSHFGPSANLLENLEELFETYGSSGTGKFRRYLHSETEASFYKQPAGTFTNWEEISEGTDLLFYEGLHGGYSHGDLDIAKHVDLLVGVVPIINLEWIQKLHRDRQARGYSQDAIVETILRRMPDYVNHITPQFSRTHINFQRVPLVDTSNPFIARDIPLPEESLAIIRFAEPKGINFEYLLSMLDGAVMTRPNSFVIPGGKTSLAMQFIFTPLILRLIDQKRQI